MHGREACAFLLTDGRGGQRLVRVENLSGIPDCFAISRHAVNRTYIVARRLGMDVRAFIHSHPHGVEPSDADRKSMATSAIPWIIAAMEKGSLVTATYHLSNASQVGVEP